MKTSIFHTTVILTGALVLASASLAAPPQGAPAPADHSGVKWQTDLRAAHKLATAQNKPMLVVFGADWCGYCKKLEKQTLNSPDLSKYINETFIPVHLDLDKEPKIAKILEVESLPCSLVLSPNADLLGRIDGYLTVGPFYQKLAAARMLHQPIQTAGEAQTMR